MPRLLPREEAPVDDLTSQHADPEERPSLWVTGIVVDGSDPFAARRRAIRERNSGPDPAPEPPAQWRTKEKTVSETTNAYTTPTTAAHVRRGPSPMKGRKRSAIEKRTEIIYCTTCNRQLNPDEYGTDVKDVVMTTAGGITTTTLVCSAHNQIVAHKTEFVIRPKAQEAGK